MNQTSRRNNQYAPQVWHHKFYCLSTKHCTSPPQSRRQRQALDTGSLGEKVITVGLHSSEEVDVIASKVVSSGKGTMLAKIDITYIGSRWFIQKTRLFIRHAESWYQTRWQGWNAPITMYITVVTGKEPDRTNNLLAYIVTIAKASVKAAEKYGLKNWSKVKYLHTAFYQCCD